MKSSDVHLTYIYKLDLADPAGQASADLAQKVRLSVKWCRNSRVVFNKAAQPKTLSQA